MSRAEKSARLVARATKFFAMVPNILSVIIALFPLGLYIKFVPVYMQRAEAGHIIIVDLQYALCLISRSWRL
jgi:hypothetical protein